MIIVCWETGTYVNAVIQTSDGGFVVGGTAGVYDTVDLGDCSIPKYSSQDGIIIKYNAKGETEWAECIGGNSTFTSISETLDGGYIVAGYFSSKTLRVGNYLLKRP